MNLVYHVHHVGRAPGTQSPVKLAFTAYPQGPDGGAEVKCNAWQVLSLCPMSMSGAHVPMIWGWLSLGVDRGTKTLWRILSLMEERNKP